MTIALALPGWAVVSPRRAEHVARVTALTQAWARAMGVPASEASRWERAALLHDALRDAEPAVLASYTAQDGWPAKVWHGPAAAAAAERHGERDPGVLSAVRYHSLGWKDWDDCGRVLFLADYLEPGREYDRAALDALAGRVPHDLAGVLRDVTALRLAHLLERRRPIRPETAELWNSLVDSAASF